jgi:hypothetical protein
MIPLLPCHCRKLVVKSEDFLSEQVNLVLGKISKMRFWKERKQQGHTEDNTLSLLDYVIWI